MSKPYVFSNLAISVDGKITTQSKIHFPLGSKKDLALMRVIRDRADSVIMGAETLRAWKKPCLPKTKKTIWNAIVSRNLDGIDPSWLFFKSKKIERLLFVSEKISPARLRPFKKTCTIVLLKSKTAIASQVIHAHRKLGLTQLLVEGGGGLMSEFVRGNQIDRYYITITPRILGGNHSPTLVDGEGLSPARVVNLKLEKIERVGSELFLVYQKLARRGKTHPLYSVEVGT